MEVCYSCDIVFNENECPLCGKEERIHKMSERIDTLLRLEKGGNTELGIARKEIQKEAVDDTIKHFKNKIRESKSENIHGISFCIGILESISNNLGKTIKKGK